MRIVVLFVAALALAATASAQTLFKLIDKKGKVTYSETEPKPGEFDGQVIRMDVDPNANRMTAPKADAPKPASSPGQTLQDMQLREAHAKLDIARRNLEAARASQSPEDVQRLHNKGGGSRAVPTEEYNQRIAQLEEEVRRAEAELQRLTPPPR